MKVVLIGLGMVAKTHVRAIASSDDLQLHGVFARDVDRAGAFAKEVESLCGGAPKVYDSVASIGADSAVDFVIIATPPNARIEASRVLAAAGKPVLMEKPLERNAAAAAEIVALFEEHQLPLGVVFQHRARESSQQLAALLASGRLGAVAAVDVAVPWWREQSYYDEPGRGSYERDGGGVLISQAIHTLDLMLSLFGAVDTVQAIARTTSLHRMESEDFVSAGMEFANGAVGSLLASTASYPGGAESIVAHCENASIDLREGTLTVHWRKFEKEVFGEQTSTGGGADPMAFTHAWHQGVIENFAAVVENGTAIMAPAREALAVQQLIDALILSSSKGQSVPVSSISTSTSEGSSS